MIAIAALAYGLMQTSQIIKYFIILLSIVVPVAYAIIVVTYFYISPYLIVCEHQSAFEGLKQSYN